MRLGALNGLYANTRRPTKGICEQETYQNSTYTSAMDEKAISMVEKGPKDITSRAQRAKIFCPLKSPKIQG